jgi:hypothetical protein
MLNRYEITISGTWTAPGISGITGMTVSPELFYRVVLQTGEEGGYHKKLFFFKFFIKKNAFHLFFPCH